MSATLLVERMTTLGLLGYTEAEAVVLYDTVQTLRPDLIVEWGTNTGHSARLFVEARDLLDLKCAIHSVDVGTDVPVLRPEEEGLRQGHHVRDQKVALHIGDGPQLAALLYRQRKWSRPLFYIDDNHEYQRVLDELFLLASECPRAVLLLHDAMVGRDQEPDRALKEFLDNVSVYETHYVPGVPMVALWPKTLAACR